MDPVQFFWRNGSLCVCVASAVSQHKFVVVVEWNSLSSATLDYPESRKIAGVCLCPLTLPRSRLTGVSTTSLPPMLSPRAHHSVVSLNNKKNPCGWGEEHGVWNLFHVSIHQYLLQKVSENGCA